MSLPSGMTADLTTGFWLEGHVGEGHARLAEQNFAGKIPVSPLRLRQLPTLPAV